MVLTVTDLQREQQKNMHNNNFCEQEQKWKVGSFTTNTQNLCSFRSNFAFRKFQFFSQESAITVFPTGMEAICGGEVAASPCGVVGRHIPNRWP